MNGDGCFLYSREQNVVPAFMELPVSLVEEKLVSVMTNGDNWHAGKDPGGTVLDGMIRYEVTFSDYVV